MSQSTVIVDQKRSVLRPDGSRAKVLVEDVKGRFQQRKAIVYYFLLLLFFAAPWIKIQGHPLIFLDILHRRFYLFGFTFNAQDSFLLFFLLSGMIFSLFFITAIAGRIWCGWTCPQTVLMDGLFRKIERFIEGPRAEQIRLANAPWGFKKTGKFILKQGLFIALSLIIAHTFISYFVSIDNLFDFVRGDPRQHWVAFLWTLGLAGILYFDFAWFREQVCLIVCPYGRFQGALIDDDSMVIGYDTERGEPRGKPNLEGVGDCIDCLRCVRVCPTGIDIREGLQMECIGCANCIDACDAIMDKLKRPRGLIRYDSLNGLMGKARKIFRPRLYIYLLLMALGAFAFWLTVDLGYKPFEANLLRLPGAPYVLDQAANSIRNQYSLHISNKTSQETTFKIEVQGPPELKVTLPMKQVKMESLDNRQVPLFVEMKKENYSGEFPVKIQVTDQNTGKVVDGQIMFLGPNVP